MKVQKHNDNPVSLIDRIDSYGQRMDIANASEADKLLFELLGEHSMTLLVHAVMINAIDVARVVLSDSGTKLALAAANGLERALDASAAMTANATDVERVGRLRILNGMPFGRMQ